MALLSEERFRNLVPLEEYRSKKLDKLRGVNEDRDDNEELTEEEQGRLAIARFCLSMFEDAVKAREPYETFDASWDLYVGNMWPANMPKWKATITINKIRAFIHFMQAVMTDNKPRIAVDPLVPGTEEAAVILRKLLDRDWDENEMQEKISLAVLYGLIWGTGVIKLTYNPKADGGRGKHEAVPVVPYRVFFNPTATCIEDSEYVIHIEQKTLGWIARNYPEKFPVVKKFKGARIGNQTESNRDFLREGNAGAGVNTIDHAVKINNVIIPPEATSSRSRSEDDNETIEVAEFWFRDDTWEVYERHKIVNGVPQMKDAVDPKTGLPELEVVGSTIEISPLDGEPFEMPVLRVKRVPEMEKSSRLKYPNGRLVVMAGPCVLRDIPNPFQIDGFPFAMWKNQDVGTIWGQGEPLALKDCNIAMNRIVSQVYDILEKTGNPSFMVKKGSGFDPRSFKNKPGSLIPLDEMDALKPLDKPLIPVQFLELYGLLKAAMGEVAGLQDSVMGNLPGGNTSFATIDQLQESGAAQIRQKVRNMERMIKRCGTLRIQLIQQFDKGDRPLRERVETPPPVVDEDGETVQPIVPPSQQSEVQFRKYSSTEIQGQVEFSIVPVSSLSTSPAGLWNRYLQLWDKHLIDQESWHEKFKLDGWRQIVARLRVQQQMAAQAKKKPGPQGNRPARTPHKPQAPQSNIPTREANSSVR